MWRSGVKGWRDCCKDGKEKEGDVSSIRQECGPRWPLRHCLPNLHPLIKRKNKDMHVIKTRPVTGSRGEKEINNSIVEYKYSDILQACPIYPSFFLSH